MTTRPSQLFAAIMLVVALAACGAEQGASGPSTTGQERTTPERTTKGQEQDASEGDANERLYTPPKRRLPPPEPAKAPALEERPAGQVFEVGPEPEGLAADPETGLVAVGLRDPDELALVDGASGEVVRRVALSGSPRHLNIAGPGGPVLAPGEPSDSFAQVSLPDGQVVEEMPVDNFPHDAAATPGGERIFVVSEAPSTASVIEGGRVIETIKTPLGPGGVATTENGLVGIVGVRGLALEVFEANTLDSIGIIDAGEGPTHVKVGPGNRFYVADTRGDAILVYEARPELELLDRVDAPGSPYGIAIDPERNHLWATLTAENRLLQYALEDGAPREIASYPTVRQPNSVAVDPESGRVFVVGREEGVLQIIDPGSDE
jgi:DNA-binding beta-propeller fold protein YncE